MKRTEYLNLDGQNECAEELARLSGLFNGLHDVDVQ